MSRKPISEVLTGGMYDCNAPKFTYRRNVRSFDRKTNRTVKGTILNIGGVSPASKKKQKGQKFPHTRPMIGWERVFAGRGRFIKRGHRRKSKMNQRILSNNLTKFRAPKFTKWVNTYDR